MIHNASQKVSYTRRHIFLQLLAPPPAMIGQTTWWKMWAGLKSSQHDVVVISPPYQQQQQVVRQLSLSQTRTRIRGFKQFSDVDLNISQLESFRCAAVWNPTPNSLFWRRNKLDRGKIARSNLISGSTWILMIFSSRNKMWREQLLFIHPTQVRTIGRSYLNRFLWLFNMKMWLIMDLQKI